MKNKEYRERRRKQGLCVSCSNKISSKSTWLCDKCLDRNKNYARNYDLQKRGEKRKKRGLCRNCPNKISSKSKVHCDDCLEKNRNLRRSPIIDRYYNMKTRSRCSGLQFLLNKNDFVEWYEGAEKACCYCGATEEFLKKLEIKKNMLTVDRKDNTDGYRLENICLACFKCNTLKNSFFTEEEWKEICQTFVKPRFNEYHH